MFWNRASLLLDNLWLAHSFDCETNDDLRRLDVGLLWLDPSGKFSATLALLYS